MSAAVPVLWIAAEVWEHALDLDVIDLTLVERAPVVEVPC